MAEPDVGRTTRPEGSPGVRPRASDPVRSTAAAAKGHYDRVRQRAEASTPGQVTRRMRELDVMNHALIMASLSLTLLIPALVTVSAVVPLGNDSGIAAGLIHRLGLSGRAADDLRALFPARDTVAGSTTAFSGLVTVLFAIGWPAELQRGYEAIWALPSRGLRDLWRSLAWLVSFFGMLAMLMTVGSSLSGPAGTVLTLVVGLPVAFAWTWWTQHLLLGGRVSWPELLPGALATGAGLTAFSIVMNWYLPYAIVDNYGKYGPIGVVLALISWVIGFSVVMLGGPLIGHTVATRRR